MRLTLLFSLGGFGLVSAQGVINSTETSNITQILFDRELVSGSEVGISWFGSPAPFSLDILNLGAGTLNNTVKTEQVLQTMSTNRNAIPEGSTVRMVNQFNQSASPDSAQPIRWTWSNITVPANDQVIAIVSNNQTWAASQIYLVKSKAGAASSGLSLHQQPLNWGLAGLILGLVVFN